MKDLIEGAEFLGIPMTVVIVLVAIFLIMQVIGELIEFKGKAVPEFLKIRKYFSRKKQEEKERMETLHKVQKQLNDVNKLLDDVNKHYNDDNITKRNDWMSSVDDSVKNNDALIQTLDSKIDRLLETNENLTTQLEQVKSNVLENEADRLRSELFDCGNRCRRNIRLHPEEMEHIRTVFTKYSDVLHQNGPGETEFQFITDYYNHQDFPTYHQPNN